MTSNKTKLTLADAATVAGKSTNTLNRAKNSGKISVEIIDKVAYYDVSELARVYPKTFDFNRLEKDNDNEASTDKVASISSSDISADIKILEEKLNSANKLLEKDKEERTRERDQLEDRITKLETALEKSQNHETRLLEYQKNKEGEGTNFDAVLKPIQDEISQLKLASEIEKTKSEELAKEKNDLKKASMVYGGLALIIVIGVGIFALMQSGIIQIN